MPTLRILLCGTSAWRKNTVRELNATGEDVVIVGEVEKPIDLLFQTTNMQPHVVALPQTEGGGEPGICSHLLLECPGVVILLFPPVSGAGSLSWMVLSKGAEPDSSPTSLRVALRRACNFV